MKSATSIQFDPQKAKISKCIPVSEANVTSVISRYTSTVNDYTKKNETCASKNFHHAENKFDLTNVSKS